MHEILNQAPNRSKPNHFHSVKNMVKYVMKQRLKMAGAAGFEPATYGFGDTLFSGLFRHLTPNSHDKNRERAVNIRPNSKLPFPHLSGAQT